jgi:hypothetical protein
VSATFCVAVGTNGVEALGFTQEVWTWNGSSWARTAVLPQDVLERVACVSSTRCVTTGWTTWSVFNGSSWSTQQTISGITGYLSVLSCQTATSCVAGSTNGQARTFNWTSWSAPVQAASSGLTAVSCTQGAACVAVTNGGAVVQYLGWGSWRPQAVIDPGHQLEAVSCPTASYCLTADEHGFVTAGTAH